MHIVNGFHVRQILDEIIAIPGGEAAQKFSGIVSLNEIGKFLFELLQSDHTEDELVSAILAEYDTDAETARADVLDFLNHLRRSKLLIE